MPSRPLLSGPIRMATDAVVDNPCLNVEQGSLSFYQALLVDDKRAWECLYISAFRSFIPYARQRSPISTDDALDILQDGMAEFALKLKNGRYAFQGKPVAAYVFKVCRNQWVSFLRKNSLQPVAIDRDVADDETDSPGDGSMSHSFRISARADGYPDYDGDADATFRAADSDVIWGTTEVDWKAVGRAFAEVSEDCRTMLHCFYVEEKSLGECGAKIGLQENSAKVKRFRCAQRLKTLYSQYKTA